MNPETSASIPRPEHPRPDRFRATWRSLNGEWGFATDHELAGIDQRWFEDRQFHQRINVPFTYQHELSGINHKGVEEVIWYSKDFDLPSEWIDADKSVLLHFGAVDYRCIVWINGIEIGRNEGGHVPFEFDIAPYAKSGTNRIVLRVEDPQDPSIPRGKQAISGLPASIFYYCTSGIWQSVWLESVSRARIADLVLTTTLGSDGSSDVLTAVAYLNIALPGAHAKVEILREGILVASNGSAFRNSIATIEVPVQNADRWSPESPSLYEVRVTLLQADQTIDVLDSYTGFRTVEVKGSHFYLNGEPYYLQMVLDQGYWPKSGLTAPTDEDLRADVDYCKQFGFNGARKHQKVEDPRWLYWCDKLGLIVWGEMANAFAWSVEGANRLSREWDRAVRRDRNHPCVATWVPVNESWGVPYLRKAHPEQIALLQNLVALTRSLDPTRPVVDNDGWEHTEATDIYTLHDYTKSGEDLFARYKPTMDGGPMQRYTQGDHPMCYLAKGAEYRGQPVMLTEVGGFLSIPEGVPKEKWDSLYLHYGVLDSDTALVAMYAQLMEAIAAVTFVVGFCYTQLTDVEQEANGLLTYDRRPKVSPESIRAIHQNMISSRRSHGLDLPVATPKL